MQQWGTRSDNHMQQWANSCRPICPQFHSQFLQEGEDMLHRIFCMEKLQEKLQRMASRHPIMLSPNRNVKLRPPLHLQMTAFDKGDNRPNWHRSQWRPLEDKLNRWVICIAMLTVILLGKYIKESLAGEGVSDSILSAMSPLKMVSHLSA